MLKKTALIALLLFALLFSGCASEKMQEGSSIGASDILSSINVNEGYQWKKVEWNSGLDKVESELNEELHEIRSDELETVVKTVYEAKDILKENDLYFTLSFSFDDNMLSAVTLSYSSKENSSDLSEDDFTQLIEKIRDKFGKEEDVVTGDVGAFLLETYLWQTIALNENTATRMQVDKIMQKEKIHGISIVLFHY